MPRSPGSASRSMPPPVSGATQVPWLGTALAARGSGSVVRAAAMNRTGSTQVQMPNFGQQLPTYALPSLTGGMFPGSTRYGARGMGRLSGLGRLFGLSDAAAAPSIAFWVDKGRGGAGLEIKTAVPDLTAMGWAGKITSAMVAEGDWELYTGANYTGSKMVVTKGQYIPQFASGSWNDRITSARPVGYTETPATPTTPEAPPVAYPDYYAARNAVRTFRNRVRSGSAAPDAALPAGAVVAAPDGAAPDAVKAAYEQYYDEILALESDRQAVRDALLAAQVAAGSGTVTTPATGSGTTTGGTTATPATGGMTIVQVPTGGSSTTFQGGDPYGPESLQPYAFNDPYNPQPTGGYQQTTFGAADPAANTKAKDEPKSKAGAVVAAVVGVGAFLWMRRRKRKSRSR